MTNDELREFCERQMSLNAIRKKMTVEERHVESAITELARFWLERQGRKPESVNERLLEACKEAQRTLIAHSMAWDAVTLCADAIAAAEQAKAEAALPITEEWLDEAFGIEAINIACHDEWKSEVIWISGIGTVSFPTPKTRGQLLALLSALKGEA